MRTNATTGILLPTVHLTTNKSRRKQQNNDSQTIYYLQDGEEFELELFNPTSFIFRADISLNDKLLSGGGLVLKPGERVFLDRYLDTPKKFKFETYEVGKSKEVEKAIQSNGLVKVQFHKEQSNNNFWTHNPLPYNTWSLDENIRYNTGPYCNNPTTFTTTTSDGHVTLDSLDSNTSNTSNINFVQTSFGENPTGFTPSKTIRSKLKETGRVGEGSNSDQTFQTVNYDFEYFSSYDIEFKILPISEQIHTSKSISVKRYCSQCGVKSKPNFKFCPNCGNKI